MFIYTFDEYLQEYLGISSLDDISSLDWLTFSEHRLLALTSGKLFIDELNLGLSLAKIAYFPENVKLYLIASNWSLIAEEQAFVRRCSDVGDELGSMLVCSRIAERLMRLSFLYCNKYAPYSKWFGKAFYLLSIDEKIKDVIWKAVSARTIAEREDNIVDAQKMLADLHNTLKITEFVDVKIDNYFGRNIKVIFADKLFEQTAQRLEGTQFTTFPFIGSLSEVPNFNTLSDSLEYRENIKALYAL